MKRWRFSFPLALAAIALGAAVLGDDEPSQHGDGGVAAPALAHSPAEGATNSRRCDRVLKRGGNVRRFVRSLRRGETGCLRRGTYRSRARTIVVRRSDVVLRSYPGERARVVGRLWITRRARDVVVTDLKLNGLNRKRLPSPTVNGSGAVFKDNNVTNRHTAICFAVGNDDYGRPTRVVIKRNRIHDCGELPATNHHHGIYVGDADNTVIRGNLIYGNADRGIQLYPDADGSRIVGNVIDGNGQGLLFSGEDGEVSDGNIVKGNLITNSTLRHNVLSHWNNVRHGRDNVVRDNCVFGGPRHTKETGGIEFPAEGFVAFDNRVTRPLYVERRAGDFRLRKGSGCRGILRGYR